LAHEPWRLHRAPPFCMFRGWFYDDITNISGRKHTIDKRKEHFQTTKDLPYFPEVGKLKPVNGWN